MGRRMAIQHVRLTYLGKHFMAWQNRMRFVQRQRLCIVVLQTRVYCRTYYKPCYERWKLFTKRRLLLYRVFALSHTPEQEDDILARDTKDGRRLERAANVKYREQFYQLRCIVRKWRDWTNVKLMRRWQNRGIESIRRLASLRLLTTAFLEWSNILKY
jgi:hypothetical protein